MVGRTLVAGGIVLSLGCELTETVIPRPDPIVVVHAVLNAAEARQFVIVEYSANGRRSSPVRFDPLLGQVPAFPISGATVTLTHHSPPGECPSAEVVLEESVVEPLPGFDEAPVVPSGIYATTRLCRLEGGDHVSLRVSTPAGEEVTGETTVPAVTNITLAPRGRPDVPRETIAFHRLRDSLTTAVHGSGVVAMQVDVAQRGSSGINFVRSFLSDSLERIIPGSQRSSVSDNDSPMFRAGLFHEVAVAAVDRNFFDFARSAGDIFTGRGFINHLEGGIGVFGSVVPARRIVRVVTDRRIREESIYTVRGTIDGARIDVAIEPYRIPEQPQAFYAFVEGTWLDRPIAVSADGLFRDFAGEFAVFFSVPEGNGTDDVSFRLSGTPSVAPGVPFELRTTGGLLESEHILTAVWEEVP